MAARLRCPLLAVALLLSLPLTGVAEESRLVAVERVDVLRGRVSLELAGGLVTPLPDGEYAGPGVRVSVSSSRIEAVHASAAAAGVAAEGPDAEPPHPVVETAWVRDGRLLLANRSAAQLELPSGAYTSPRGVTLELEDRCIRSIRAPEDLLRPPPAASRASRWLRMLALLVPFRSHRPPVIVR
jgi:hypothetical protein